MNRNVAGATAALITVSLVAAALGLPALFRISNEGDIHVPNPNLAASTANLQWGNWILPNSVIKRQVNFTNTGDAPTDPLVMSTQNLNVGTLRWNMEGTVLQPNQTETATFTLTISSNPPDGVFSFTITVQG